MSLPFLDVPRFPTVPIALGVPPVLRSILQPPPVAPAAIHSDGVSISSAAKPATWGIYDSGNVRVVEPDSVVALDYLKEYRISDYPVEEGGFSSYNKVATPFDARVRVTKGGNEQARGAFLNAIEAAAKSLDLYSVVTPEVTYTGVNLTHLDYRRDSRNGATLITVDLWLVEVRVTATTTFSQTKTPAGADAVNDGAVQAQPLTPDQQAAAAAALASGPPDGG